MVVSLGLRADAGSETAKTLCVISGSGLTRCKENPIPTWE